MTICDVALRHESAAVLQEIYCGDDLPEPVRIIARLLHSLDRGVTIVDRARDHWLIARAVHARSPLWGTGYRWIVLDFFSLLLVIADGLGVTLPDDFRTWLRTKPRDDD